MPWADVVQRWLDARGGTPRKTFRHNTALRLASALRHLVDYDAGRLEQVMMEVGFVRDIVKERGAAEISQMCRDACARKEYKWIPRSMRDALKACGITETAGADADAGQALPPSDGQLEEMYREWAERMQPLLSPGLDCAVADVADIHKPAAALSAMAMYGTYMTRCYYTWWDGEPTRLNYNVYIIGEPASGKGFAARQDEYIMACMRSQDRIVREALEQYKQQRKERETSSKAQKGEALKMPDGVIRYLPSRTSNSVFFRRTKNAVEEQADGTLWPLHLYTFDSELGASNSAQKGGTWIDKRDLELKAFHNELTGVDYANSDSVNECINVFWNTVYTGTPVSLAQKFTAANINDGLCSRIAICRMFPQPYVMKERVANNARAKFDMREWGYRLDGVKGELADVSPLVEFCYRYTEEQTMRAELEQDPVRDYLRKRVGFYGMNMALPRCVMRQWDAYRKTGRLSVDDTDIEFARLMMDIILTNQLYYFAEMLLDSWKAAEQGAKYRRRENRTDALYRQLPDTFTVEEMESVFQLKKTACYKALQRWRKDGVVSSLKEGSGKYEKLLHRLK